MKQFIWLVLLVVSTNVYAQHGLMIRCGGGPEFVMVDGERVENPLRLRQRLLLNPDSFFDRVWQQAMDIKAIQGTTRVVFHNPNGWEELMGWSSSSMLATPKEQLRAFKKFMEKANRDSQIIAGVYMCSRVPKTLRSNRLEDIEPMQLFDYSKLRHRNAYIYDLIHRYRKNGITEFYFDASAKHDRRESFAKLIAYLERKGLTGVAEGIPRLQESGELDIDHMDRVHKAIALDRFWYIRETRRDWDVSTLPERHEYMVVISGHQTWDDNVPQENPERKEYIKERMRLRLEQGLTVLNMQTDQHEDFLAALTEHQSNQNGRIRLLQAEAESSENP